MTADCTSWLSPWSPWWQPQNWVPGLFPGNKYGLVFRPTGISHPSYLLAMKITLHNNCLCSFSVLGTSPWTEGGSGFVFKNHYSLSGFYLSFWWDACSSGWGNKLAERKSAHPNYSALFCNKLWITSQPFFHLFSTLHQFCMCWLWAVERNKYFSACL